ncbi:MAG: HEPN domain-containing protein [Myxococcales bacterium]|nr:HEPN domain-containing protein [Myxococcales bacterium]
MTRVNREKAVAKQLQKARRSLEAAEHDLQGGFNEAALSRAYYCTFHAARAALLMAGVQPRTHRGVNERFNLDLVVPGHLEAEYLSILGREQADREQADYSVDREFTKEHAATRIAEARRFLERIEGFLRNR